MEEKKIDTKKLDELKGRVNNFKVITINRVPEKDFEWFTDLAKEDYANDYGMFFKELVRVYHEYYWMRDTLMNLINLLSLKEKQLLSREESNYSDKEIKVGTGATIGRRKS